MSIADWSDRLVFDILGMSPSFILVSVRSTPRGPEQYRISRHANAYSTMTEIQLTSLNCRRAMLCHGIQYQRARQGRPQVHTTPHDEIREVFVPGMSSEYPILKIFDIFDCLDCAGSGSNRKV